MTYPPRVFTVILNYKNAGDTLRCISSLRASRYRSQFPVVVDNDSEPRVVAQLRAGLPATPVIESAENLGYAGGNNLGVRYALERDADFVWILNPDTTVEPETLTKLVQTMTRFPDIGIAGCRILNGKDGGQTIWYNGATIDWSRAGHASHTDIGRRDADVPDMRIKPVDYVTGASMFVRREVFEDIGLLPERYFLYFEETDFNVRAFRRGWRLVIDPGARALHFQRSWNVAPEPYYVFYYTRNRVLFAREFSDLSLEEVEADLLEHADGWRQRIARARPAWLPAFERVVAMAIEDARAGRDGKRAEITGLTWETASA